MMHRVIIASLFAMLAATPVMAGRAPLELGPSSKWDVNYGAERCTLARDFGTGDSAVHLQFDSFGSWNDFRVQVSSRAMPHPYLTIGEAGIRMSGDADESKTSTLQGSVGGLPAISFNVSFAPYILPATYKRMSREEKERYFDEVTRPQPQYDATVDQIAIRVGGGPTFVLNTGNMASPLAVLRSCIDDMYKSWGSDPAQQKLLSRGARPTKSTVLSVKADYPGEPLLSGLSAYVPVRLMVDATGKANSCVVQAEGIDQAFRTAVCNHLQGKFEPALDAHGKPVASMFHTSVFYLPNSGG